MGDVAGRCLCGSTTFRLAGDILGSGHCHCESCRRATSSPVTTFFTLAKADVTFGGIARKLFRSSPGVLRGFCGNCGSPLSFETERRPAEIDIYVAALDPGGDFAIAEHWHWDERVAWLECDDDLPKS